MVQTVTIQKQLHQYLNFEDSDIEVDDEQMGALLIADSELDWIDEEDVVGLWLQAILFDLEITADIRLKVEDEEIC